MRKSEYKAGTFLADRHDHVFIHDGYIGGDGYGVIIGETSGGKIEKASDFGNFCKWPIRGEATEDEIYHFLCKVHNGEHIKNY